MSEPHILESIAGGYISLFDRHSPAIRTDAGMVTIVNHRTNNLGSPARSKSSRSVPVPAVSLCAFAQSKTELSKNPELRLLSSSSSFGRVEEAEIVEIRISCLYRMRPNLIKLIGCKKGFAVTLPPLARGQGGNRRAVVIASSCLVIRLACGRT
jgi:hypothetical protein